MPNQDATLALAGGAIGAVLTVVLAQAGRAYLAWAEVTMHNEEAAEINSDLAAWVDDRTIALEHELKRRTGDANSKGLLYSGGHGVSRAHAKADALQDYRDREWHVRAALARLRAAEGPWHGLWRLLRRSKGPRLTIADVVKPFLNRWREPVTKHGGEPVAVLDRTTRTLADGLADLPARDLT